MADESQHNWPSCAEAFQPVLDHAVRCWQAEEENSRRLAGRVAFLSTGIFALVGAGIFKLLFSPIVWPSRNAAALIVVCLLFSVALIVRSMVRLWDVAAQPGSTPSSSSALRIGDILLLALLQEMQEKIDAGAPRVSANETDSLRHLLHIVKTLDRAASDLATKNTNQRQQIRSAQQALVGGVALIGIAAVLWASLAGVATVTAQPTAQQKGACVNGTPDGAPGENLEGTGRRQEVGAPEGSLGTDGRNGS